jgi:hypothetical protein
MLNTEQIDAYRQEMGETLDVSFPDVLPGECVPEPMDAQTAIGMGSFGFLGGIVCGAYLAERE